MKAPALVRGMAVAFLVAALPLRPAAADPVDAVQAASLMVVVKGVRDADSAPIESHGSGFFTSRDGYLVTSYHLVSSLLDRGVDEKTLTFSVTSEGKSGQVRLSALPTWKDEATDLMVLRARIGNMQVQPLEPNLAARAQIRPAVTPVFTGGYPDGYEFVADRGYIKSFEGPQNTATPAWVTSMTFKEGQSGSPVVMEDGRVVAVVKAVDLDATSIGILVPIWDIPLNYWQDVGFPSPAGQAATPGGNAAPYSAMSDAFAPGMDAARPVSAAPAMAGLTGTGAKQSQRLWKFALAMTAVPFMAIAVLLLRNRRARNAAWRRKFWREFGAFFAVRLIPKIARCRRTHASHRSICTAVLFPADHDRAASILPAHHKRAPLRKG